MHSCCAVPCHAVVCRRKFGRIDILVANAGVLGEMQLPQETTDENWKNVFATNVRCVTVDLATTCHNRCHQTYRVHPCYILTYLPCLPVGRGGRERERGCDIVKAAWWWWQTPLRMATLRTSWRACGQDTHTHHCFLPAWVLHAHAALRRPSCRLPLCLPRPAPPQVEGVFHTAKLAHPLLKKSSHAKVVVMSSIAGGSGGRG